MISCGAVAVSLVGLGSLYLGWHYLTDVIGAVLVSGAVAVLVESVRPRRHLPGELPGWTRVP